MYAINANTAKPAININELIEVRGDRVEGSSFVKEQYTVKTGSFSILYPPYFGYVVTET